MSVLELETAHAEDLGELIPVGRPGGQGRVYRPAHAPFALGGLPVVVKLYRRPPSAAAVDALAEMVAWRRSLAPEQCAELRRLAAWPLEIVSRQGRPAGIVMEDLRARFEVPFLMPSGRREPVLLSLEHLLGSDEYLQLRGLRVRLDTRARAEVAACISAAISFLHRHGIVVGDIAPNNVLVAFKAGHPEVCLIDCDSMVFRGRQALAPVETGDWQIPPSFGEPLGTRAADAYKLGLVVLRLFARSHEARSAAAGLRHVPAELRTLLGRALGPDAANRPPAGEWQRALRELLARGGLNERYPGPAPAPIARMPAAATSRPQAPPVAATARAAPIRAAPAMRSNRPQRKPFNLFTLAWLVIVMVVLALILARLAAPLAGQQGGSGSGPYGGAAYGNYQSYPAPQGPGSAFR